MHIPRPRVFSSLIPFLVMAGNISGEELELWDEYEEQISLAYAEDEEIADTQDDPSQGMGAIDSPPSPFLGQISVRSRQAGGIGYNTGYSTLQGFFGLKVAQGQSFLFDLRGHMFNNGTVAANGGIAYRIRPWGATTTFGINTYYDYRNLPRLNSQQIGCGIEVLSKWLDFRSNGYIPFGKEQSSKRYSFDEFDDHFLVLRTKRTIVLPGVDVEVGRSIWCHPHISFYGAVGSYYFGRGDTNTSCGLKARVKANIFEYLSLEGIVTHDHLFHTRVQGELSLNIPLGKREKRTQNVCIYPDLYQLPERQEIIVAKKKYGSQIATTSSGDPLYFLFINNTAPAGGDGTFEHPFSSMASAQAAGSSIADAIYYLEFGNVYNEPITLNYSQKLMGSGITQIFDTEQGDISVPTQSNGFTPQIIYNAGIPVTISNNVQSVEMSGVYVKTAGNVNILYSGSSNGTVNIHDSVFVFDGLADSIYVHGNLIFTQNTVMAIGTALTTFGAVNITHNTFTSIPGPVNTFIGLTSSATFVTGVVSNNTFACGINTYEPIQIVVGAANGSFTDLTISNNLFSGIVNSGMDFYDNGISATSYNNINIVGNNFSQLAVSISNFIIMSTFTAAPPAPFSGSIEQNIFPVNVPVTNLTGVSVIDNVVADTSL